MTEKKVLIVEDDALISNFIQIKLEEMGYSVPSKARTGIQAIEMAQLHEPDLILMDVKLEGEMDGIQAVEEITRNLDIPVIFLTASSDEYTIKRLMKTEPHGFIIKPFDDRILSSAIHIAVFRHRMKKELTDIKEMLRTTIQSIDDMVFSLDINGIFTHNHSGDKYNIQVFKSENIIGKNFKQIFPAAIAKKLYNAFQWVVDYKKAYAVEISLEENESIHWFNCKFTQCKDVNGNISGITLVVSDITENKNMYQELVVSQEKLSEAHNIARLGSCDILFREKKMIYNELFFEILGIHDQQTINSFDDDKMLELIHPLDKIRYKLVKKQVFDEKKKDYNIDFRIIHSDGDIRYIHLVGQVKYDLNDEAVRLINTIQDMTWQKNNEKLRHDVELAQKTAQMKQQFLARLSHEIRNPLSGITGLLHLIEKTNLDEKQTDYIQALKSSSDSLLVLLNDVLDYTKIESGMMKVKPVDFDIRKTIKNLYTFFLPSSLDKNLDFKYYIKQDIPDKLVADENKLVQVISNFISNAFKFTNEGHVFVNISSTAHPTTSEGLMLKVEVEDTGIGIKEKDKLNLFREFSQIDTANLKKPIGTGLGLSICKQLIELMGGEIGVESQGDEKGSTFWFTLPVLVAHDQLTPESSNVNGTVTGEKLDCSVLLVEDMLVNQKVIKIMLEDMGCKVSIAANGQQAVEMFRETTVNAFDIFGRIHYDIILMDHIMPVMDGVTAIKKLRNDYGKIPPVILLTADETFAHNEGYLDKGFDDCIIKPIKVQELYTRIKTLIKLNEAKQSTLRLEMHSPDDIEKKPVINPNTLEIIMRHATKNNFNIGLLFESFIEDMDRIHDQSLSAIEMNDMNSLKLIVLTVKGLSGNIGASQVHATAKLMDQYIRNDEFDEAAALLPLLTEKYHLFKNKIEHEYLSSFNKGTP
jgi:PAS domain S-box-containing protein